MKEIINVAACQFRVGIPSDASLTPSVTSIITLDGSMSVTVSAGRGRESNLDSRTMAVERNDVTEALNDEAPQSGEVYGYIRVSSREQNEARQVDAMLEFGITPSNMYMDKQSGKDFKRPAYLTLLDVLQPGDVLVVKSIDRLGRNYRYVDIQNKEVVMNGVEIARFDTLSLEDRMLVMMAAMGLTDTAGDFRSSMSDAARALAADIDTRVAAMTDSQRAARMDEVNVFFPPRLVTVNGVTYEGVGIVLIINANGNKSYERYTFYDANGVWKLHLIEEGKYVTVD